MTSVGFVGRERELGELVAGLDDAIADRGRLFLLVGEPGIGKTRLADELSARASKPGARALWGRCWEGGGQPPFWPWVQILRTLGQDLDAGRVSPDRRAPFPELSRSLAAITDSEHARSQLFDGVTRFLRDASHAAPLVLVLDDLHAADLPSLLLLRFVARQLHQCRILVIGTYRDAELRARGDAANAVEGLAREATRIVLEGLSIAEVGELIRRTVGTAPPRKLIEAVHRTSDGNPFFVDEIVRLWIVERPATSKDPTAEIGFRVPERLSDTTRRRLAPLSAECRGLLSVASVIGRELDLSTLEHVANLDRDRVTDLVAEALRAEVVSHARGGPGGYAFAHALIRETLYEDLDLLARMRLHRKTGEVLEKLYGDDLDSHLSELAHHFLAAAALGDADRAIGYATRAGARAREQLAYEEAATAYRRALRGLDLKESPDEPRRCDLLLAVGEAESAAGNKSEATLCFHQAADLARRLGLAEALARAALGLGGVWVVRTGTRDEALLHLLEEALQALGEEDGALRASLLARLAIELRWSESAERCAALSADAVAMTRRIGDDRTLAFALMGRHWAISGPDDVREQLEMAAEIIAIAERLRDRPMELVGRTWRMATQLGLGRLPEARDDIQVIQALAEEMPSPHYRWWSVGQRVMLTLLEGRFDEAERLVNEAFLLGQEARIPDAAQAYGLQIAMIRREQGRLPEIEGAFQAFVEDIPLVPAWRSILPALYMELGREPEARAELEPLVRGQLRDLPRDNYWLAAATLLGEVAAALSHREAAELLHPQLLPYADRCAVAGPGVLYAGPVSRAIGLLASTLSHHDEAVARLEAALEESLRMGARPYVVRVQVDLARVLRARGTHGDEERSQALLDAASAEATALRMTSMLDKIQSLTPVYIFRQEGRFWILGREGSKVARLKEMRGFPLIAYLLSHPATEFSALELSSIRGGNAAGGRAASSRKRGPVEAGLGVSDLGDAGEMLDQRAKIEYRRRLSDLKGELEKARARDDPERAERTAGEIEAIMRELARGVGLGGRDRRAASAAERARVAVTKALRSAITRIAGEDEALGRHLQESIRTGSMFSYRLDRPTAVSLSRNHP